MLISLILRSKINEMSIHSFYFADEGGEYLLRQAPEKRNSARNGSFETAFPLPDYPYSIIPTVSWCLILALRLSSSCQEVWPVV
jgi:hypothetical protein